MGLAIDGNEVHGIAKGGQAFLSIGNTNKYGSINISGRKYAAMPVSFTIPKGTHLLREGVEGGYDLSKDCDATCVGTSDKFYYFSGYVEAAQDDDGNTNFQYKNPNDGYRFTYFDPPMFVKKDEVKNIRWQ